MAQTELQPPTAEQLTVSALIALAAEPSAMAWLADNHEDIHACLRAALSTWAREQAASGGIASLHSEILQSNKIRVPDGAPRFGVRIYHVSPQPQTSHRVYDYEENRFVGPVFADYKRAVLVADELDFQHRNKLKENNSNETGNDPRRIGKTSARRERNQK